MSRTKKIGTGFICLAAICAIAGISTGESGKFEWVPATIIFVIIGLILLVRKTKTKEEKESIKKKEIKRQEYEKKHLIGKHQDGLPLAVDMVCDVVMQDDGLSFKSGGNIFNLPFDRITGFDIKTEEEIHKQYVSSVGGAVGGAVLFGALGAIVGGRAKEKRSKTTSNFLIITYTKDQEVAWISLQIDELSKANAWKKEYYDKFGESREKVIDL